MTPNEAEQDRVYPDGLPLPEQPHWRRDFPTDTPEDDLVGRREFAKFLVLTSGAFVAGQGWIALNSLTRREGPLPEKKLVKAADVAKNEAIDFRYPTEDDPCLLMRLDNGELVAFGQNCTHLSCAVIPHVKEGKLHCPCHNGSFEAATGQPTAGPPRRPLPRITLKVKDDGNIWATGMEGHPT